MDMIHPLLDKEKQFQAKRYEKEKRLLGLASMVLSLVILLGFYFSGLSAWLANLQIGNSIIWTFLLYVLLFQMILVFFGLPLSYYSNYIHEHKWNFSNHTVKSWLWEQVKGFLVGLILMLILLGLLFWIMAVYPQSWWWIAGLAFAFVSIVLATIFPVVILPIFNKYTPVENKELTDALERILSEGGLRSSGFFKEDMSRQTKKENAFLAGLGKTRRVVLGDNLMENMSVPEIESIIAHEVGHYKNRHIWKNLIIGTLEGVAGFFILNLAMRSIFSQFLSSTSWNLTLFPVFVVLAGGISAFIFSSFGHALSRYFEKKADRYALENIQDKKAFMTAMAGLADRNLSNAYPEWWVKLLYYSHPPVGERLAMAENYKREKNSGSYLMAK
ncbi:MAG: M48 family metalloprotease [Candidatus Aminicenantes bacterium]|nr:M48 family metalloprotease [Candidatus Aminicenantes bacterium]